MKVETKINIFSNLFYGIFFGIIFTIIGGLIASGTVDWVNFPITVLVGVIVGFTVGMIIPVGKWSVALANKLAKPGTFLFNFIMYSVILLVLLLFMCPVLTVFMGSFLYGAPVMAVLPGSFSLFIPFYLIGIVLLMIFGGLIMKLAIKCAGAPDPAQNEENQKN